MAFQQANVNGRYDRTIKAGQDFLKTKQWDEAEGKARDDAFYGGAGYGGGNSRPDLSNTAFFIEALRDTGLPADDPACRRRWCSCRGARTSRASSTTSPGPARSTTAASSTRRPRAATAWPARRPTAASGRTPA